MRMSLPAIAAALVPVAQAPEIDLESSVRISPVDVYELGKIRVNAAGVATWHPNAGVTIPAAGLDLHLRTDNSLENLVGNPTVVLNTTLFGSVTATSTCTFPVPSWSADQSKNWPQDHAEDFTGVGSGNALLLVTAIAGIASSTNLPANSVFSVWGSSVEANFVFYGFKRNVAGPSKTPKFVEIPDGYDSAAAVKKGRSESASLELAMVHVGNMGGLSRYNGRTVSVLVDVKKNGVALTQRLLYTGYGVSAAVPRGDGDGEVVETSSGPFQSLLSFVAP